MPALRAPVALRNRLENLSEALTEPAEAEGFFSPQTDLITDQGVLRGVDQIREAAGELLQQRAKADIVAIRRPARERPATLVDSVFENGEGRGWVTEIWDRVQRQFVIRATRIRVGSPEAAFKQLDQQDQEFIADEGLAEEVVAEESEELREKFGEFRQAFNAGDTRGVTRLFTTDSDAIAVFSFLDGRAQILGDRQMMGDKAERMAAGTAVINPDPTADRNPAQIQGGEPKVIRFLSPNLALVDGTAQIGNIPRAHGFSPREMTGVYTDVWTNAGGEWQMAATRPWF